MSEIRPPLCRKQRSETVGQPLLRNTGRSRRGLNPVLSSKTSSRKGLKGGGIDTNLNP